MNQLTEKDLKPFQTHAAGEIARMMQAYPGPKGSTYAGLYNQDAELQPFLCRLRAVTGAGKTPTLALISKQLGPCIILWTTNRSAVISQTHANLDVGGKYVQLLPDDTKVYTLGQMSPQDWTEVFAATTGVTILYATVASFNQDRETDKLKIHQNGYWDRLEFLATRDASDPFLFFMMKATGRPQISFRACVNCPPKPLCLPVPARSPMI